MYSNVSAGAQTYAHAAVREQKKRELAIMQKRDGNNNGTNKCRCLALRPSLSGVCSNQAQPHLADGMNQLQGDCLHSQSNMSFFTLETRGHPIFTALFSLFFHFSTKIVENLIQLTVKTLSVDRWVYKHIQTQSNTHKSSFFPVSLPFVLNDNNNKNKNPVRLLEGSRCRMLPCTRFQTKACVLPKRTAAKNPKYC